MYHFQNVSAKAGGSLRVTDLVFLSRKLVPITARLGGLNEGPGDPLASGRASVFFVMFVYMMRIFTLPSFFTPR